MSNPKKAASFPPELFECLTRGFVMNEIIRAHRYLIGTPPAHELEERLLASKPDQLMMEARMIGAAVALRQQVEAAEAIRAALAAERAARGTETALKS